MKRYQEFREKIILAVKGMLMGMADIIPGVSGGTIALISGIYEHLIMAISSVKIHHLSDLFRVIFSIKASDKRAQSLESLAMIPWNFIVPLLMGISTGILLFSRIIPGLLHDFPLYTYSFFFGLILFSLSIPYRHMHKHAADFIFLGIFALLTYLLTAYGVKLHESQSIPYIFLCGALAICAMILPGISGAYILLILGEYDIALNAIHPPFNYTIIFTLLSGMAVGLFSFVRLLKYLLFHYHSKTMAALTGAMLGSMYKLWPLHYIEGPASLETFMIFFFMAVAGMAFIFGMEKAALAAKDPEPPV